MIEPILRVTLIVATDRGGIIGRDGRLPWHLPADLKRFRKRTLGKPIIMGRATRESLGRPLDGRLNIVLSRRPDYHAEGSVSARSPDEALRLAADHLAATGGDEAMVIGGAGVFSAFLDRADRIDLTVIDRDFPGDTRFPIDPLSSEDWRVESWLDIPADERNPLPHRVYTLSRAVPR